jgi:hypothetical protein
MTQTEAAEWPLAVDTLKHVKETRECARRVITMLASRDATLSQQEKHDTIRMVNRIKSILQVVEEQAMDHELWGSPRTLGEAHMQLAIRRLHRAIEGHPITRM